VYFRRHAARLSEVLPAGEEFGLVFAGNHAQGAIFKDGRESITPELSARIEGIARALPEFYFGRFDVRYENIESFKRGEGFKIVEINGAGAEATHIWDARVTLREAYRTLFTQFGVLFEIGAANRARGHKPATIARLARDILEGRRLARRYPPSE
jgi:hypothetical protein